MPLLVNLRHVEEKDRDLKGSLSPAEMDLNALDELIHITEPLVYDLHAQKLEQAILVQGTLRLTLNCECARCLKPYQHPLVFEEWACHVPLTGEDQAPIADDSVDLTPYIREDIVLAFPQHPLCDPECKGLTIPQRDRGSDPDAAREAELSSAAWAELNKLKF